MQREKEKGLIWIAIYAMIISLVCVIIYFFVSGFHIGVSGLRAIFFMPLIVIVIEFGLIANVVLLFLVFSVPKEVNRLKKAFYVIVGLLYMVPLLSITISSLTLLVGEVFNVSISITLLEIMLPLNNPVIYLLMTGIGTISFISGCLISYNSLAE